MEQKERVYEIRNRNEVIAEEWEKRLEWLHVGSGGRWWANCREWIYLPVKIRIYGQNDGQNPWLYYSIRGKSINLL